MKKSFVSLLLAFTLFTTVFYSPKSEALVGFIFKNRIVKVIGGIGSAGGATLGLTGYITAATAADLGAVLGGVILLTYGIAITGVGLIILDDGTPADLEFKKIALDKPELFSGFSINEIATYNSELEELNAIRKTIATEVSENNDNTDEAEALWYEYSYALSPATVEIAEAKAKEFVENFRR